MYRPAFAPSGATAGKPRLKTRMRDGVAVVANPAKAGQPAVAPAGAKAGQCIASGCVIKPA